MCGIIACRTNGPAVDYLQVALRRLEYRGYDSVGVALRTADGTVARLRTVDRIGALDRLVADWPGPQFDGVGIGHTRWATHGAVTESNAHPHTDCTGEISLVHNGIITNADALRESLTTAGHTFASTVDSEVLCHLIEQERVVCGDLFDAVQLALNQVEGSWALAALEQGTGRIVLAAHGSPLLLARTPHGDFAASDIAAIVDWADEFQVLDDGDVVDLTTAGRWCNRGIASTPTAMVTSTWTGSDTVLSGYSDYMAKEIDEQPEAVTRVLDALGGAIANGALWNGLGLPDFQRLQVVGCGTSLNAGRVIGNLVSAVGGFPVRCSVASEAGEEILESDTLCLAISQSGETADVLRAVSAGTVATLPLLGLTNNPHSTLARRADGVVVCAAGPEIGVAATKTFVCQVVAGAAVMISALVALDRITTTAAARLVDDLRRIPEQLFNAAMRAKQVIPPITEELATAEGFVFIARGSCLPYAAEGALKLKELTYRWAEHCPAGELKHGPLALISAGTPVVAIDDSTYQLGASIAEVGTRGGRVISIGAAGTTVPVVEGRLTPWGPLATAVPLQILARTLALTLGRDVDKPRNLAKSVTVE
jgi:glucosamine--fructose-6-phosphate aminotransferase (isomerizing)